HALCDFDAIGPISSLPFSLSCSRNHETDDCCASVCRSGPGKFFLVGEGPFISPLSSSFRTQFALQRPFESVLSARGLRSMPTSDNGSYFSRFVLKFLEIVAAGLATAVSGYLIAHLSGVLSTPVPAPAAAVIQVPPNGSKVSAQPNGQSLGPGASTGSGPSAVP